MNSNVMTHPVGRLLAAGGSAAFVTIGLFLLMMYLIWEKPVAPQAGNESSLILERVAPPDALPPAEQPPKPLEEKAVAKTPDTPRVVVDTPTEAPRGPRFTPVGVVHEGPPQIQQGPLGLPGAPGDGAVVPRFAPEPLYPQGARAAGKEGQVKFAFVIDETGAVRDVQVVDYTDRLFVAPAMQALLKWRFWPKVVDGRPMAVHAVQVIEFKLDE